MSTNKTPNLSLHAWTERDRFDRGEFNENFSALDTAFGRLMPMKKLMGITLPTDVGAFDLNLAGTGWADHRFVILTYDPADRETDANGTVRVVNTAGSFAGAHHRALSDADNTTGFLSVNFKHPILMLLFPNRGNADGTVAFTVADQLYYSYSSFLLADTRCIQFYTGGSLLKARSKLTVWGVM